jgi:hypothetical protein
MQFADLRLMMQLPAPHARRRPDHGLRQAEVGAVGDGNGCPRRDPPFLFELAFSEAQTPMAIRLRDNRVGSCCWDAAAPSRRTWSAPCTAIARNGLIVPSA